MNNYEATNPQDGRLNSNFLNIITVFFMYTVILIFYAKKMIELGPGNRNVDVWMNTLVEAVGVSTFTYVFPSTIQNSFQKIKLIKHSILLLMFDILYAIVYAVFIPRPLWLNIILCLCTIGLIAWTSVVVYQASKLPESGQAIDNNMDQGLNTSGKVTGSVSENERVT